MCHLKHYLTVGLVSVATLLAQGALAQNAKNHVPARAAKFSNPPVVTTLAPHVAPVLKATGTATTTHSIIFVGGHTVSASQAVSASHPVSESKVALNPQPIPPGHAKKSTTLAR